MRRLVPVLALALLATVVPAAPAKAAPREITYPSGKDSVGGYLVVPEGKGPFPAIVVIHEWWGLNDWIKENARYLATQGFVCLAPDLYRGKVTADPKVARELSSGLPKDRAAGDLKAAVDYLAKHEAVDKDKIGVIGWCMGGGLALQSSLADERLKACAICYGRVVTTAAALEPLQARVLGVFGKEDRGIPIESVRKFKAALEKAGKKVEGIGEYAAGHGFMRPKNADKANPEYRAAEARAAWAAIDKFFARSLKGK